MLSERDKINDIRIQVITRFWPVAFVFFIVHIPISFLVTKDIILGWIHLISLAVMIGVIYYYKVSKNIFIVVHLWAEK